MSLRKKASVTGYANDYCNRQIGLMRHGQLLAESSPSDLLEKFQTDTLEEAFLRLSQQQVQNLSQMVSPPITSAPAEIDNIVTLDFAYKNSPKQVRRVTHTLLDACLTFKVKNKRCDIHNKPMDIIHICMIKAIT